MKSGWTRATLGEVLLRVEEPATIDPDRNYEEVTVKLWGRGVVLRREVSGADMLASKRFIVRASQFILSRIDARNGAMGVVPPELDGAVVSNDFPVFGADPSRLDPSYLGWLSKTDDFVALCAAASEGTTNRVRLKESRFLSMTIPLPPLPEQRRIIGCVEGLSAKVEEAQWLQNATSSELNSLLLSELCQSRLKLASSDVPQSEIGALSVVATGGTPSRSNPLYWGGDIPWIKTGELLDGTIERTEEHITEDGLENSSARLFPPGTVLVALYGQGQTRGRTGVLAIAAATNQACCAILPIPSRLEPRFVQYWLRSLYGEMREFSRAGAQPNWNSEMIKKVRIAVPPIPRQRSVVAYLDRLQGKIDALKPVKAATSAQLDALRRSIVDQALNSLGVIAG